MERIIYQRTLDVHKNGIQFTLQGVETGDNLSRVVEISLMASGDAIDFPLENILPVMYVKTPKATEPSIIECTIKDNTVVYEVLPIVEEGITEMQLKLIETSLEGARKVLVAPRFAVEVTKSNVNDESAIQKSEFTALEQAVARAKAVYDKRFLRIELASDLSFKAYYADGTIYTTDILKQLFNKGDAVLAQSFARGGTGVRANEDTDNAMYYSNVSKSASLEAHDAIEDSEEILKEVRLHGVYTAFKVDFESGEVEYISPSYQFNINTETGEIETNGEAYSFEDEIGILVSRWLAENNVDITNLQNISEKHTGEIDSIKQELLLRADDIARLTNIGNSHANQISTLQSQSSSYSNKLATHSSNIATLQNQSTTHGQEIAEQKAKVSELQNAQNAKNWTTLASVSNVQGSVVATLAPTERNLGFTIDKSILKNYPDIRMVIKAGSFFKVYSGDHKIGSETAYSQIKVMYRGENIIFLKALGTDIGSGGSASTYDLKLQEDLVFYLNRDAIKIYRTINHNQEITNDDKNGLDDCFNISVQGLGQGYGTVEWSFVAEFQGRE